MRKNGVLNTELLAGISGLGHKDCIVIADAGLPVPDGVKLIDLSLDRGTPSFESVLHAVMSELAVESFTIAKETLPANPHNFNVIQKEMAGIPSTEVTHDQLKEMSKNAKFIVRTGECTPYSNILIVASAGF